MASAVAIKARGATIFFSRAALRRRATICNVCLGQVVTAPISACSAATTLLSGRFSTKLCAERQSAWPDAINDTAGVLPNWTSSDSICTPSRLKRFAIFWSIGEITLAALASTRSRSCGSGWGKDAASVTVSRTNFCVELSFFAADEVLREVLRAATFCAEMFRDRPNVAAVNRIIRNCNSIDSRQIAYRRIYSGSIVSGRNHDPGINGGLRCYLGLFVSVSWLRSSATISAAALRASSPLSGGKEIAPTLACPPPPYRSQILARLTMFCSLVQGFEPTATLTLKLLLLSPTL